MSQKTTLDGAILAGDSSLTVQSAAGFPVDDPFTILIDSELLSVTDGGSGTTSWTVSRAYLSTTAAGHANGATITHVPDALADLDDLVASMALGGATDRYGLLTDLLADVSADIHSHCMRTFWVPTADVTVYLDVDTYSDSLQGATGGRTVDGRALDIVSITTLSVRDSETGSYTAIAAGDTGYYLQGGPPGTGVAGTDWPYTDVLLSPQNAAYTVWPIGRRAVRIVGQLGFPVIPAVVKRATISETRERFRQSIGGGPAQIGTNAFGQPIFLTGMSPDMRRVLGHPFSLRPLAA